MTPLPPHLHSADPRFRSLVHGTARLDRIATGFTWTEGPVWFGDHDCLIFSDIPSQRLMRWSQTEGLTVFRRDSHFNNGNTRDRQGRLLGCRHGTRDVVRTEPCGALTVLAAHHEGRRLNSPNDLVVTSDGAVWFTDPTYGIISNFEGHRGIPELAQRNVFRIDPVTGDLTAVITDFLQPNGLAFSPDERRLYVAESGMSHDLDIAPVIRVFDVEGTEVRDAGIFCTLDAGYPDGLRTDTEGNVWTSAGDGVHCFAPDGTLLGKILIPEQVSNLCFGGHRLFMTGTTSVYSTFVDICGAEPWTRAAAPA
ncbi:SMP-30/gluconolactonase/LRE family protein [Falsirhodobacter algicola]|uniref:SMP-30/gluconolactonase/LRE family protein n=1 Tax=Falsirhodobacter algicola TaxID=2692330 RepID=A0A8J8SLB6_9RHOB|nr:SMP-30/gluconolactonase/LRE family protein [Falsirhodobacter algicola]QUS36254.1 SMP-30/gluconolactonase/LRE family protein [Falsirhodobacter algicola]